MIDSGAIGRSFVDETFAQKHALAFHALEFPRAISVVNGRRISSGAVTYTVRVPVVFGGHTEMLQMFVTKLGRYSMLLGIPWLRTYNPYIRWAENVVIFESEYCRSHCLPNQRVVSVEGYLKPLDKEDQEPELSKSVNAVEVTSYKSRKVPARSAAPEVPARSAAPEVPARSVAPEVPARNAVPEVPARSVAPEVPARNAVPEVPAKSAAPDVSARNAVPDIPAWSKAPEAMLPARSKSTPDVPARNAVPDVYESQVKLKSLDISLIAAAPFNT